MAIQQIQPVEQAEYIEPKRRLFTLEEYDHMIAAGVFDEDERLELIRGEILKMPPIGPGHETIVARLTTFLVQKTLNKALVWPQGNSIGLPISNSRPEPDAILLKWRDDYYAAKRPTPEDVLLIIEVSDSTLKYDRNTKVELYAQAGIGEYWIISLRKGVIEVYTEPSEGTYQSTKQIKAGDTLTLPAQLGIMAVSDILGTG